MSLTLLASKQTDTEFVPPDRTIVVTTTNATLGYVRAYGIFGSTLTELPTFFSPEQPPNGQIHVNPVESNKCLVIQENKTFSTGAISVFDTSTYPFEFVGTIPYTGGGTPVGGIWSFNGQFYIVAINAAPFVVAYRYSKPGGIHTFTQMDPMPNPPTVSGTLFAYNKSNNALQYRATTTNISAMRSWLQNPSTGAFTSITTAPWASVGSATIEYANAGGSTATWQLMSGGPTVSSGSTLQLISQTSSSYVARTPPSDMTNSVIKLLSDRTRDRVFVGLTGSNAFTAYTVTNVALSKQTSFVPPGTFTAARWWSQTADGAVLFALFEAGNTFGAVFNVATFPDSTISLHPVMNGVNTFPMTGLTNKNGGVII